MGVRLERNPYLFLLLRNFLRAEADFTYGRTVEDLEDYLAAPRPFVSASVSHIRLQRRKINEEAKGVAASLRRKVLYDAKCYFAASDEMLNRLVQCLTFFGKFHSWYDFENSLASSVEAMKADKLKGRQVFGYNKLTPDEMNTLTSDVEETVRREKLVIVHCHILEGYSRKKIIRLRNDFLIRPSREQDLADIDLFAGVLFKNISKSFWTKHAPWTFYILVDTLNRIQGFISLSSFDENKKVDGNEILSLNALDASQLNLINTLLVRVPEIVQTFEIATSEKFKIPRDIRSDLVHILVSPIRNKKKTRYIYLVDYKEFVVSVYNFLSNGYDTV